MAFFKGKKIINRVILRERLDKAIDAIREYDTVTAAEWRKDYPDMAKVLERRATGEDSINTLHRELTLRLAEFVATDPN
jgi:hypothetical protein